MEMTLHAKSFIKLLVYSALVLIGIHSAILVAYYIIGDPDKFDFVPMFDLDMEKNIPTLFSSLLFTLNAVLFYFNSRKIHIEKKHGKRKYWLGLSWIFLFLAFDESAVIHEKLGDFLENYIDASGVLYYPWVVGYSVLLVLMGILYLRFFLSMEKKILKRFILAAIIFLTGAVGFELLGAQEAYHYGTDSPLYSIYYTIEESLEMFGLIYLANLLFDLLDGWSVCIRSKHGLPNNHNDA